MNVVFGLAPVVAERPALREPGAGVERPRGCERGDGAGLDADPAEPSVVRNPQEMTEHRTAQAPAACRLGRVHRLQLGVLVVEALERADGEQLAVDPEAVERDRRVGEAVDVERVPVLGRDLRVRKGEVTLQQPANLRGAWVGGRDRAVVHVASRRQAGRR